MGSSPSMSLRSRNDVLEQLSRSHLVHAQEASSASAGAANAAFQAGYCALMASLSPDEVSSFADHPNATAAVMGAQRLHLVVDDLDMARDGASDYYSPAARSDREVKLQVDWARRARAAAGWPE